jgi:hypothetical protein
MSSQNDSYFCVSDDLLPKIKPGVYDLVFVEYETARMFKGNAPKLVMWFRIVTLGEYFEVLLPRYYNVQNVAKRRTKNGSFKAGPKSDFMREYCTLFPGRIGRLDRIPMSPFRRSIIKGRISLVKEARGREIPAELQYSRIEQLIKVVQ